MSGDWGLWLTSGVIAAIVAGIVNLPKVLGEGRKSTAEAEGERFNTYRATTDATITELRGKCDKCAQEMRELRVVIRALVRALDLNDQTARDEAIGRARDLI